MELVKLNNGKITTIELLKEINFFRAQEGRNELKHYDLLKVIREEFDEEIREGKISFSQYDHKMPTGGIKKQPMFELTFNQAKQVLVRESKVVRKAVIKYIEKLEEEIRNKQEKPKLPQTYLEALKELVKVEEEKLSLENKVKNLTHQSKLYTATEIAKELGFKSASEFNKILEADKIQYKVNGTWVLTAKYADKNYTSIKQFELENGTVIYDKRWNGLGRQFLIEKYGK